LRIGELSSACSSYGCWRYRHRAAGSVKRTISSRTLPRSEFLRASLLQSREVRADVASRQNRMLFLQVSKSMSRTYLISWRVKRNHCFTR
uniref:Ovule protein n=1 Tax=Toxocara canis TaxID=6265 RepID=A0A183V684_TOXCA